MFKRVNWNLALAEVALLVLGVGLALAADAWNDRRIEREAEAQYLDALRADFEQTRANFVAAQEMNSFVRDNDIAFLQALEGPPGSISLDSVRALSEYAFWTEFYEPVFATYYDLVNSGDLALIRSDSLRLAMARFEKSFETLDRVTMEGWEQYNLVQVPYIVENLNFLDFYGEEYFGLVLPGSSRQVAIDAYWAPEFSNILAMTIYSRHDMVTTGEESLGVVEEILRLMVSAQRDHD